MPAKTKPPTSVYIVLERQYEYDDNYYNPKGDEVNKVYLSREKAEKQALMLTQNELRHITHLYYRVDDENFDNLVPGSAKYNRLTTAYSLWLGACKTEADKKRLPKSLDRWIEEGCAIPGRDAFYNISYREKDGWDGGVFAKTLPDAFWYQLALFVDDMFYKVIEQKIET